MSRIKFLGALALAAGLCLAAVAPAADQEDRGDKDKNSKGGDQHFVQKASAGGLAEVNLGQLALRTSTNPAVRAFAERMVRDHTMANQQVNQAADRARLTPAATMDKTHWEAMAKLTKMQGAAFDRAYVNQMVKDHEQAVKLFENESKNGKNAGLKNVAKTALPTLKEHLKMAKDLQSKLGGSGGGDKEKAGGSRDKDKSKSREDK